MPGSYRRDLVVKLIEKYSAGHFGDTGRTYIPADVP